MPRALALQRSITFWSGLLVMAFLGWAWRDSMSFNSYLNFPKLFFLNAQGGLTVTWRDDIVPVEKLGRRPPFDADSEKKWICPAYAMLGGGVRSVHPEKWKADYPEMTEWHATQRMQMLLAPTSGWMVFVPHWLMLLAVAVVWLGLLLLRALRRRKAS